MLTPEHPTEFPGHTHRPRPTDSAVHASKLKQYALTPVPSILRSELSSYIRHRVSTFAAKRSGAAVVSATAEHDTQSLLKFYGWMARFDKVPRGLFYARRSEGSAVSP